MPSGRGRLLDEAVAELETLHALVMEGLAAEGTAAEQRFRQALQRVVAYSEHHSSVIAAAGLVRNAAVRAFARPDHAVNVDALQDALLALSAKVEQAGAALSEQRLAAGALQDAHREDCDE